jgi:hypothetical protein
VIEYEGYSVDEDTGVLVPKVNESMPPIVKEGLTRRRLTLIWGRCPCGAPRPQILPHVRRGMQRRREVLVVMATATTARPSTRRPSTT